MKKILLLCSICTSIHVFGQDGVLIGTKPTAIDNSAELEIFSNSLGVLLPRVASTASIAAPVPPGLLIYDISQNSYAYFDGAGWVLLPIAKFSEIHDIDNDTRVTAEKTADADKIQIERAGTVSSIIDNAGINMSTGLPYQINNTRVGTVSATSVYLGSNAGGTAPSSASNVMTGTNAGTGVVAGTGNVVMGYGTGAASNFATSVLLGGQAGAENAGNDNVLIGSSAGIVNSSGINNVFVGNLAGNDNTIGASNVLIGHNAGEGLSTGTGNVVIGVGTTLNASATDSLKIGNIIAVKDNVTFNNAYSFPNAAGTVGQTMVLDADKKTLKWVNAGVSSVDQTVIGSAAGLYSFDFGAKGSDIMSMQRQMFIVPLVAASSASISQLMTWKKVVTVADEVTQMALYDENFNLLSVTTAANVLANPTTAFISQVLATPQNVIKDKTYYIGIRSNGANTDYAGSTMSGTYYYMDTNGDPSDGIGISTGQPFPLIFKNIMSGGSIPLPYSRYSITDRLPWVRAF